MPQTVKLPEDILYNYSRVKCITAVDGRNPAPPKRWLKPYK